MVVFKATQATAEEIYNGSVSINDTHGHGTYFYDEYQLNEENMNDYSDLELEFNGDDTVDMFEMYGIDNKMYRMLLESQRYTTLADTLLNAVVKSHELVNKCRDAYFTTGDENFLRLADNHRSMRILFDARMNEAYSL